MLLGTLEPLVATVGEVEPEQALLIEANGHGTGDGGKQLLPHAFGPFGRMIGER